MKPSTAPARTARQNNARLVHESSLPSSSSIAPGTTSIPTLSQTTPGNDATFASSSDTLTNEEQRLVTVLCDGARALRWPARGEEGADPGDVIDYFENLRAGADTLHEIHQKHPQSPQLASCIHTLQGALSRLNTALQRGAIRGGLDGESFDAADLEDFRRLVSAC